MNRNKVIINLTYAAGKISGIDINSVTFDTTVHLGGFAQDSDTRLFKEDLLLASSNKYPANRWNIVTSQITTSFVRSMLYFCK